MEFLLIFHEISPSVDQLTVYQGSKASISYLGETWVVISNRIAATLGLFATSSPQLHWWTELTPATPFGSCLDLK